MAPVITRPVSEESLLSMPTTECMPLGEYLFIRVLQANPKLRSIFGIPGDFNLALLEHLYSESLANEVEFIGICNELNAAYAADGYSKVIKGLSVLITTFGVGELSAINGIAGAFAEFAPVLHIVGTTSTKQIAQAMNANYENIHNIHHLVQSKNALAAPNHDIYKKCIEDISVATESLDNDVSSNLDKIDHVICKILKESRPGYLFIPSDVSDLKVPRSRLATPLDLRELRDVSLLEEVSSAILNTLYHSRKPSVLGDALVSRFRAEAPFTSFIEKLPSDFVKLFNSPMGRHINEELSNFVGVYAGCMTGDKSVVTSIEQDTDALLVLGYLNNEQNTGNYSINYSHIKDIIQVHPDYVNINGKYIMIKSQKTGERAFSISDLMNLLTKNIDASKFLYNDHKLSNIPARKATPQLSLNENVPAEVVTQNKLVDFFNQYLRQDDILVVETCSFLFATPDLVFPKGLEYYSQQFYGSIGYALPATLGVCRAERDLGTKRRIILVQGDGSAQMTVQELSSYLRYDIQAPEIFLLNNEGYTVERIIKGPTRSYNDIKDDWNWTQLFEVFGDVNCEKHSSEKINTSTQLADLFNRKKSSKIEFFELRLAKLDVPQRFRDMFT